MYTLVNYKRYVVHEKKSKMVRKRLSNHVCTDRRDVDCKTTL